MIISLITSIVTTFLIIRLYLNWHYKLSIANFRELQIELATSKLVEQYKKEAIVSDCLILESQLSLGLFFKRLIMTYGIIENKNEGLIPALFYDNQTKDWTFFINNIQPTRNDLNNNSFLGWFNFILNVKKLTVLWEMCNISELIVSDTIALTHKYPQVFEAIDDDKFKFDETIDNELKVVLIQKCLQLKKLWFMWLKLNNI